MEMETDVYRCLVELMGLRDWTTCQYRRTLASRGTERERERESILLSGRRRNRTRVSLPDSERRVIKPPT